MKIKNIKLIEANKKVTFSKEEKKVLKKLIEMKINKKDWTLTTLSGILNKSLGQTETQLNRLRRKGYLIELKSKTVYLYKH